MDELSQLPELFDDFEQARILGGARARLFGGKHELSIGRYRIERRLGAGAMGEVYLGVDTQLHRKVALKRVLASTATGPEHERERRRLRREAQALARLSHPNVVQVYEVGEHQGRTYLAMEYVEGQTLAAWLAQPDAHAWPLVLARFIDAGRGLAAAHRAKLVHRDFKPDNVLLRSDGTACVADFGLVLASEDGGLAQTLTRSLAPSFDLRLSTKGAVIGTVRYMPLEQLRGAQVDARSDQFSFCVALYEALWGQLPFPLDDLATRLAALEADSPIPPPKASVPAHVWRALRRGLDIEPTRRWPSMDALLAALEQAPARRPARVVAAAAVVASVVGLAAAGVALFPRHTDSSCSRSQLDAELDESWGPTQRERLRTHFATLSAPHRPASSARVLEQLDAWSSRWLEQRTQLCTASEDTPEEAAAQRRALACLADRRRDTAQLVELLHDADAQTLARAVTALAQLPQLELCAAPRPRSAPPTPADSARRTQLARARWQLALGQPQQAEATLAALDAELAAVPEARALAPLRAESLALHAALAFARGANERGLSQLEAAVDLAEIAHADVLAAELWIELCLRETTTPSPDPDALAELLRRARVASERAAPLPPETALRLQWAAAEVALARDQPDALELMREVTDTAARAHSPALLEMLMHASTALSQRDPASARAAQQQALAEAQRSLGPAHPQTLALAAD